MITDITGFMKHLLFGGNFLQTIYDKSERMERAPEILLPNSLNSPEEEERSYAPVRSRRVSALNWSLACRTSKARRACALASNYLHSCSRWRSRSRGIWVRKSCLV